MSNIKGFITDINNNTILPITRGELVLDGNGKVALHSSEFAADENQYGLLSNEHYKVLQSLGSSNDPNADSLAAIATKLTAINDGIQVGNTTLHFYDTNIQSTPIIFTSSDTVILTAETGNKITASLKPLQDNPTATENVVANVTVDEYGRVTQISPTTALSGVNLIGCTSEQVLDTASEAAIVNKKYVDDRFNGISAISTGALKFKGPVQTSEGIETLLEEGAYYLAANVLENLEARLFHGKTQEVTVNRGDTLIAHSMQGALKFTIIPSGDDGTYINLSDSANGKTIIGVGTSNIALASPFVLKNDTVSNITTISIPEANTSTAGIISSELYNKILQATAKSMSYDQIVTGGLTIGQITIGDGTETPIDIQIPNYSLKYDNNVIKWSGHDNEKLNIKFEGGLQSTHSSDTCTVNLVTDNKYLKVENGVLTAIISKSENNAFTPGLIDNELFSNCTAVLATAAYYKPISKSLNNNELENDGRTNYQYGSDHLRAAIKVTI